MNLNKELKELFFCLLREGDWITGDELAVRLGWNRKKVQQNIKWLMEELGDQCSIEAQKNRGYLFIDLSEELKTSVLQEIFYNDSYFNLDERRALLVMDLLFQNDYISMDYLAETYYLSKTTVFEEVRQMKRWFRRIDNLELEVSSKRGIRIHGSEWAKRFGCVAFVQLNILKLMNLDQLMVLRYQGIIKSSAKVLKKTLKREGLILSGEDFSFVLRYIGITCLRSSLGYVLEDNVLQEGKAWMIDFLEELKEAVGYSFTESERQSLIEIICCSNLIENGHAVSKNGERIEKLERWMLRHLHLTQDHLFENRLLLEKKLIPFFTGWNIACIQLIIMTKIFCVNIHCQFIWFSRLFIGYMERNYHIRIL